MAREFQKREISLAGIIAGILLFALFILLPSDLLHLTPTAQKAIAVGLLMIVLWVTEAIPIPVTSLLPIVLFPVLGILPLTEALQPYASPVIMLFFGGFVIALALEKYNLHRRVALNLVSRTGTSPARVIAGFMIATAFLSMWISNTSTAVIMFPIGMSIIGIVEKQYGSENPLLHRFGLALMLGIAYAANVGGSGTLVGTPSNAILVGLLRQMYDIRLDFAHWLIIGIPLIIIMTFLAWVTLTRIFFRLSSKPLTAVGEYVFDEIHKLGKLNKSEKRVIVVFTLTAFFWIFRAYLNKLAGTTVLSDSLIATGAAILMFVVPNGTKKEALLGWPDATNLPWGILLLFGGGLSLAHGLATSGVIDIIGASLIQFGDMSPL
ncbi:MAG TPA: DASS family sodium-coupled anion symporter, partial [Bacteroidales bacterium]|nr:DASS family sodium-coupled anion symporter [Bacteroidales bacterium]